ncbi:MAG: prolipoprotein diacylglyceryl transferase [Lachnospiraceae bacterium]|nr:prolipoprotein diacylglyceryl transferase [Lachnospiraceae bacterium]
MTDVSFPNLGINIEHLPQGFNIFGVEIRLYAIMIMIGLAAGFFVAKHLGTIEGDDPEDYSDYIIYGVLFGILGARLYYVIFEFGYYKDHLAEILNLRQGGLAIYGGAIAAIVTMFVFTKIKKRRFLQMVDMGVIGLILGQAIGRWGNFFNCEVFGGVSDGLFAMRLNNNLVNSEYVTMLAKDMQERLPELAGTYTQVAPTFLYEFAWNMLAFTFMVLYRKHRKFKGELFGFYLLLYGAGRFWIEGIRSDQLKIGSTGIPVSQALSAVLFVAGLAFIITGHILVKKQKAFFIPHVNLTEEELAKIKKERAEKLEKEKQALKQKKETKEKETPKDKQE